MICFETVIKYCKDDISLIENYEEALHSSETYDCHHRLEIQNGKIVSVEKLKQQNLYFLRPASELIFLPHKEHVSIHGKIQPHPSRPAWNIGLSYFNNGEVEIQAKECPDGFVKGRLLRNKAWSKKISEGRLNNPIPQTVELRKKLSESHLGIKLSDTAKQKLSQNSKGRKWYNNGVINRFEKYQPDGFMPGKLPHKK